MFVTGMGISFGGRLWKSFVGGWENGEHPVPAGATMLNSETRFAARLIPRWSTKFSARLRCHNLVVLIHEMYELEIDLVFWKPEMIQ